MNRIGLALGGATLWLLSSGSPAAAHESAFTTLELRVMGDRLEGDWEIHLSDARIAVGLPAAADGDLEWDGVRDREPALLALLRERLTLASDGGPCSFEVDAATPAAPGGRPTVRVALRASCPAEIVRLRIGYDLLFDLDPAHRGYFTVKDARLAHVGVFTADQREVTIDVHRLDLARTFLEYSSEGIWHIWTGPDHLLFLLALLLPAPLRRVGSAWERRAGFASVAREVVKIVTAFSVAHSVTLVLSALGFLSLPARWVEAAIAFSVWVAAWNNLHPFLPGRGWWLALGFGLLHGLGFAGALGQLGLPLQARGLALLAFNTGVEVGQLALVAIALPLLYATSRRPGYERFALRAGSFAAAWIAAIWVLERIWGVRLLPGL